MRTFQRLLRWAWTCVWVVLLLTGLPTVLIHFTGWPLPRHWPEQAQWRQWLADPLTQPTIISALVIAGWLLWALLAYAVCVELLRRTATAVRWLRRAPLPALPTPLQATASGLLGATVLGFPAASGVAHHGPPVSATATDPAGTISNPTTPTLPGAFQDQPDAAQGRSGETGIDLDQGWLSDHDARTVAAAAAMMWLGRRRHYQPGPITGHERQDADLQPIPATVAAIQAAITPDEPTDPTVDGEPEVQTAGQPAGASVVGPPATGPPVAYDATSNRAPATREAPATALPPDAIALTGPGALPAARAILVTTLLQATLDADHDQGPQLVVPRDDLRRLLDNATPWDRMPRLTVTETLEAALATVEQAVLRRTLPPRAPAPATTPPSGSTPKLTAKPQQGPPPALRVATTRSGATPPPLVLIANMPPDTALQQRLAALLRPSHPSTVRGILLGPWLHGATCHIEADGTTREPPTLGLPQRWSTVNTAAAIDILTMLQPSAPEPSNARPHEDERPPASTPDAATAAPPAAGSPAVPAGTALAPRCRLQLAILGPPTIRTGGDAPTVRLQRRASWQILVYLAVHPNGATTGQLAAALWPGSRTDTAAGNVYTTIRALRTDLPHGEQILIRDEERYRLDPQWIEADLWDLHAALAQAADVDPEARRNALQTIVAIGSEDLAAGRLWPWLAAPREAIRRHVLDAHTTLARDEPDPAARIGWLQAAHRFDPLNEEVNRRLHATACHTARTQTPID